MLVKLTNPTLYDRGVDNPNYPAQVELHQGLNASTYAFVGDLKFVGVFLNRYDEAADRMKMTIYADDYELL